MSTFVPSIPRSFKLLLLTQSLLFDYVHRVLLLEVVHTDGFKRTRETDMFIIPSVIVRRRALAVVRELRFSLNYRRDSFKLWEQTTNAHQRQSKGIFLFCFV